MIELIENNVKICTGCEMEKTKDHFIDKNNNETKTCDTCRNYINNQAQKRRNKINNKNKNNKNPDTKICNKCAEECYIKEFISNKKVLNNCSSCRKEMAENKLKNRKENPERYKEYNENYYTEERKIIIAERDKKKYLNNRAYMLYNSAKQHAKKLKLDFNLTEEYVESIYPKDNSCPILKETFIIGNKVKNNNSPSLDRINCNIGYVIGNIQVISYKANQIKSNCTLSELELMIKNFKEQFIQVQHDIDDITRKTIIEDRLNLINHSMIAYTKYRIINIESCLLTAAKKRSKDNSLQINIDENYIKSIWQLNNKCPIRNVKYSFGVKTHSDNSPSLDRINNNLGYVKGNVMIISTKANMVKLNYTLEELDYVIKSFREYYDRTGTGIMP